MILPKSLSTQNESDLLLQAFLWTNIVALLSYLLVRYFSPKYFLTRAVRLLEEGTGRTSTFLKRLLLQDRKQDLKTAVVQHMAARDWNTVISWIDAHPEQVGSFVDNEQRQTILHYACLFNAPIYIVRRILTAAPYITSTANNEGELALHWAIRLSLPPAVVESLLEDHPTSGFVKDRAGNSACSMLWDRHKRDFFSKWEESKEKLFALRGWQRIRGLILASNTCEEVENSPSSLLHVAVKCKTPPGLFPFLLKVYKDKINFKDKMGRLPLSIAAMHSVANQSDDDDDDDEQSKIDMLLDEFPEGANVVDVRGRVPLHYALESGIRWEEGLCSLLRVTPSRISQRDPVTGLYPLALAAVGQLNRQNTLPISQLSTSMTSHESTASNSSRTVRFDASLTTVFNVIMSDPTCVKLL